MLKKIVFVLALALWVVSAGAAEIKKAKYVFLFIGDGMSLPQRMAAQNYLKSIGEEGLAINTLAVQSITFTRSNNSLITDSAASATAIACGEKTDNHFVGVNPKGERLVSAAEVAKKAGRKVGIITSVTLTHATPAGFYAHNTNRGNEYEIGLDLIASGFDYFAGGGIGQYNNEKSPAYKGSIYDLAKENGYEVFVGAKEFEKIPEGAGRVIAVENKGGAMPYYIDNKETLRLADFVKKGIGLLDNPKGFFMMVEGGKIDWMCHANDAATTIMEILEFDNAVKVALEFAKKHPRETLIVVTGDHETGGLSLGFAGTGYKLYPERLKNQTGSFDSFKNRLKDGVKKGKIAEFDDTKEILEKSFGLKFPDDKNDPMRLGSAEKEELKKAFARLKEKPDSPDFANCALRIFNNKAGVAWSSNAHTALPVATSAQGVNSQIFSGMFENTEISKNLKKILGK
ncbi:MAG: alkaline phosphatase [Opitutales bacterium]|nr:alkaline phosphatase [Opitutales bacterium]